jgi:sec-independent protein translocase protein TatC
MQGKKMIYTNLIEVFFSYLKLSTTSAFMVVMPVIAYNLYKFLAPGLYPYEKRLLLIISCASPLLYWVGAIFCYFIVIPKAWDFFISFENYNAKIPIILEAKVSEYLQLIVDLIFAFGIAFQLPVILLVLTIIGIISPETLENKRRFAIVIIFILGGILTPPDIFSQFALAIPMLLLYEISIKICKIVEHKRKLNVRP